ncbi:MAG: ATP-binding protein [Bacteroidota bacterium]|nr:ATP-binding protein [Bacteroidota bacterium]
MEEKFEVVALLTTINREFKRVSMHGVREELIEMQADSIGLPLVKMYVSEATNEEYETVFEKTLQPYILKGITTLIYGDIFLEDLRIYREQLMTKIGMKAEFPLWKKETAFIAQKFISLGFKTITCCVSDEYLTENDAGVDFNSEFIRTLPEGVDVCGENGEFHTFCYDGPIFRKAIKFKLEKKVYKPLQLKLEETEKSRIKGFWFCELKPEL